MQTLTIPASEALRGDVIADTAGGPAFTIDDVQVIGPLVIVDFANGTSSPPIMNGLVTVIRGDRMTTAEHIAQIERKLKSRNLRPGRRVELGYMLLLLKRPPKSK